MIERNNYDSDGRIGPLAVLAAQLSWGWGWVIWPSDTKRRHWNTEMWSWVLLESGLASRASNNGAVPSWAALVLRYEQSSPYPLVLRAHRLHPAPLSFVQILSSNPAGRLGQNPGVFTSHPCFCWLPLPSRFVFFPIKCLIMSNNYSTKYDNKNGKSTSCHVAGDRSQSV